MAKRIGKIKNIDEIPDQAKNLPEHAKHIYVQAHNTALEEYKDPSRRGGESREEIAHKVAWESVRERYNKQGSRWVRKDH